LKQLQFFTAHLPEQLYILQALAIINERIRFLSIFIIEEGSQVKPDEEAWLDDMETESA
jgi:hypothetical protein